MGRIVKVIGILVVAVVVLLVGAVLAVSFLVDPNDHKDQISAAVERATGRQLTIEGDLELDIFPGIRIAVGRASLSNAAGFGGEPFASIESAGLSVALLPLIRGDIQVGEARLDGLELNLGRDASGRNNWQDIGAGNGGAVVETEEQTSEEGDTLALDVGSINIDDARVTWSDAVTGDDWVLDNFNLQASGLGTDSQFPLVIGFTLAGEAMTVDVTANTEATISLAQNRYALANLDVTVDGSGSGWPGGEGQALLSFDLFEANLESESLNLQDLELEMLGMTVNGTLAGQNLFSNLSLNGGIRIQEFDPRDLLDSLNTPIETADPDVLRRASAEADFVYDSSQMGMRNMRLALDDSALTGRVGMESDVLRFDLDIDSINIDRYLPPADDSAVEEEGSLDEVDLPIEPLRDFRASGNLSFGETQFSKIRFTDASFALEAGNGRVTITPNASLYGGTYSGSIGIAVMGDAAELTLIQAIDGIDLMPFARDYLAIETLSGTGDLSLDVAATGSNMGDIRRGLDGDVSFNFSDGAWAGIDALYELRRLRAVFESEDVPARPAGDRSTPFESVAASGTVEDSILSNEDFTVGLSFMTLAGGGTVNLIDQSMNFDLLATFNDVALVRDDPLLAGLIGSSLPINVGGTLAEPAIRPDFAAVVRQRVQQEVQQEIDSERENVRNRLRDRIQEELDDE